MKRCLLLALVILPLLFQKSFAQSYFLKYSLGGTYTPLSSYTSLASFNSGGAYTIPLSFGFTFYGKTYDSIQVDGDGAILMGGTAAIVPLGASLVNKSSSSQIRYETGGSTGSHYITIECSNAGFANDAFHRAYISFKVSLREGGSFYIEYGPSKYLDNSLFYNSAPEVTIHDVNGSKPYYVNKYLNLVNTSATMLLPDEGDELDFTYTPGIPSISILSPKASAVWYAGIKNTILWSCSDVAALNVDVSLDGGATYTSVASNLPSYNRSVSYTPPSLTKDDNNCIVRVSDASKSSTKATSKFNILIPIPKITLFEPSGGEKYLVGSSQTIRWRYTFGTSVRLYYSTNKGKIWNLLGTSNAGDSTYRWTIPSDTSSFCLLKVVSTTDTSLHAVTPKYFTITLPPGISFRPSEPLGTYLMPRLFANDTFNINWISQGVAKVNIYLLTSFSQNTIVKGYNANAKTYNWRVPAIDDGCYILIEDANNASKINAMSLPFYITQDKPLLQLTSPVGGEKWIAGTDVNIEWTPNSSIPGIDIWITYDGWNTATKLGESYGGNGFYSLTVPNMLSKRCMVELIDQNNILKVNSVSTRYFEITDNSGINDPAHKPAFSMYPNPTQGSFRVKFGMDFKGEVSILNNVGQQVWSQGQVSARENEALELGAEAHLTPGVYYVKFISADNQTTQKLIVE